MYTNVSKDENYPKTLLIRNSKGGMIWQIYHVKSESEAKNISKNATKNGFQDIMLVDYQPDTEQTFPNWRKEQEGIF